ncbi:MAG: M42 family peptidase [Chloroflexi bacterium]|nr:M42 family peptidase [Chloroflexota bacterium]
MSVENEILPGTPVIGAEQLALLERLSNACGVSGDEGEVRAIVMEQIKLCVDEVKVDTLGNLLAIRKARVEHPVRVMLAAHMDEVGLMLINDEENGLYSFATVGGIDVRSLVGKPVLIGKEHVPGVIGAKPIHLTEEGETDRKIPLDVLRIDVGPGKNGKVKVGDWACFATRFAQVGPSLRGKALDNRLGVATLIELVKNAPDQIELQAAFTVQEEVGLRGARVAAYSLNPDLAFAVDSTPAFDLPAWDGSENAQYNTHLGTGPAIYIADGRTLSDPRLVRYLAGVGDSLGIPYQFRQPGGGGTDAGAIHLRRAGIPSVSVSIPSRYPHTGVLLARLVDWQNTLALLHAALAGMTSEILMR